MNIQTQLEFLNNQINIKNYMGQDYRYKYTNQKFLSTVKFNNKPLRLRKNITTDFIDSISNKMFEVKTVSDILSSTLSFTQTLFLLDFLNQTIDDDIINQKKIMNLIVNNVKKYTFIDELENIKKLPIDYKRIIEKSNFLNMINNKIFLKKDLETEMSFRKNILKCKVFDIKYNDIISFKSDQKQAFKKMFNDPHSIINIQADAGTGKTYMLSKILENKNYIACSFTNKAVSVLKDQFENNDKIFTIHSLFYMTLNPKFDLKTDILLVDEISMLDIDVIQKLNYIIHFFNHPTIIFLGDKKQLQPIGRGSLYSLIDSAQQITLTENKRSNQISLNRYKEFLTKVSNINSEAQYTHFLQAIKILVDKPDHDDSLALITNMEDVFKLSLKESLIVLSHRNSLVDKINSFFIKKIFDINTDKNVNKFIKNGLKVIAESHDKKHNIIKMDNFTVLDISKSDQLTIDKMMKNIKVSLSEKNKVSIKLKHNDIKDNFVNISYETYINCFKPSYALTVHKSQGSTFENVVFYEEDVNFYLSKNILYTAGTRSSKKLFVYHNKTLNIDQTIKNETHRKTISSQVEVV